MFDNNILDCMTPKESPVHSLFFMLSILDQLPRLLVPDPRDEVRRCDQERSAIANRSIEGAIFDKHGTLDKLCDFIETISWKVTASGMSASLPGSTLAIDLCCCCSLHTALTRFLHDYSASYQPSALHLDNTRFESRLSSLQILRE